MFKIVMFAQSLQDDWNHVVKNAKNGNFLFLTDYFKYHEARFDDISLIVYKNNHPVAVFPANKINGVAYSHSGLTYGGLIYGSELHAKDILNIFNEIKNNYRGLGVDKLIYKSIPTFLKKYPSDEDLYALYVNSAKLIRRDLSSVIDLRNKIKLSDSRKCVINKAKKNNVAICESDDIDSFHQLLQQVLSKFGATPTHSAEELKLLVNRFKNQIKLYLAYHENEIVSGCLIYDFGNSVHTQYLASNAEGRKIGSLDYMLYYLIEMVYADRDYFSFGISTENSGLVLNEGLIFQKEGFGARGVVHDFYEWDLNSD